MPTYENPETGTRKTLGIGGRRAEMRRLESEGWVLVDGGAGESPPRRAEGQPTQRPSLSGALLAVGGAREAPSIIGILEDTQWLSAERLRQASDEEILSIPGIGDERLAAIRAAMEMMVR